MLIIGGRERTKKEFSSMFAQAGLSCSSAGQVPTQHRERHPGAT